MQGGPVGPAYRRQRRHLRGLPERGGVYRGVRSVGVACRLSGSIDSLVGHIPWLAQGGRPGDWSMPSFVESAVEGIRPGRRTAYLRVDG
jgi:hypothetical protein